MAAHVLSPERWRGLASPESGQQATPRRRAFYEAPAVASPVAVNVDEMMAADDLAPDGVGERFLPQRRSPGQRSQDSGFSGYSGDSASEGSSSNNSPVPAPAPGVPLPAKLLETDVDATPARAHVSRVYIHGAEEAIDLRHVLCEKTIEPVNLSGGESASSPDKCVGDKSLISDAINRLSADADRSGDGHAALLLEHKSIVPPMRPNMSWKKLGESFRRVMSSGRLTTPSDECDKSNVKPAPESPQPTSRYLGGPRSSTPRKAAPRTVQQNNRRVRWADADPLNNNNNNINSSNNNNNNNNVTERRKAANVTDASAWDSDTPSLEIGRHAPAPAPVEPRRRRGLRMGVGVERSLNAPPPAVVPVAPAPVQLHASSLDRHLPYGLRWSPVEAWLKDLPMFYQPESTCALQNKAIANQRTAGCPGSEDSDGSALANCSALHQSDDEERTYSATAAARAQVRRLQRRAHLISTEFAQLCSFIELYEESKLAALIPLFLAHVIQFIREAECAAVAPDAPGDELVVTLRQTCAHLVQIVSYDTGHLCPHDAAGAPPVNWSLARQITAKLGQVFVAIVDTFVGREIEVLTSALTGGKCVSAARLAANSLMSLGSDAARPALRPLVEAFRIGRLRPVRADLLRALSALCSSSDVIRQFEAAGGLSVIFDVLCAPGADDEEKSEAAGLLAQITSPWLEPPVDEPQAAPVEPVNPWPTLHLTPYVSSFVAALTELSAHTDAEETLLLSTAALANLTFSHSEAVQLMAKYRTALVLVQASSHRKGLSVFIQDQIATILANMAAVYAVRAELVAHGALAALVGFLQLRPAPGQRPAEASASERVLKKSAIALSRVCGEANAAREIVELNGIERIAQLVRDPRERNYSDGVLVACLAALHKIATACGTDELERRGAADLIENRLLDVFIEYSTRPESYV